MNERALRMPRPRFALSPRLLPFADAAGGELPLGRLMRLSLFQVTVGMAVVLLNGTLNRVMVIEMAMPAWIVSLMVSLPLLFAPLRALIGFRSDQHRSVLGWRRVPYIWGGTMALFGGLAIMPFALFLLSGDSRGPEWVGPASAALAFLLVGAGIHTVQTAGLALATDLASDANRARVVALLYVTLLVGMIASSAAFALLLSPFSQLRLIQVVQGAALASMILNVVALWKQEARNPRLTAPERERPGFRESWQAFRRASNRSGRLLLAVGLGTAGFSMQDILLEPYGGEVLGLSVGATTGLTAILSGGMLCAFALAARSLARGADPLRLAAYGASVGIFAFAAVTLAAPFDSGTLFRIGTGFIGFGSGLFSVGTLMAAMTLSEGGNNGLALGAWGAVQATAAGLAIALGGAMRDTVGQMADAGILGPALIGPATGYGVVYHTEIAMLFVALVAIGPLVRGPGERARPRDFGLANFPG